MDYAEYLDEELSSRLQADIEWVEGWIGPGSEDQCRTPEGKVSLIQGILNTGELASDQWIELQALGNYLGTAICDLTRWPMRTCEDEYGKDIAIEAPGKKYQIFPTTMISKRMEAGEEVDVIHLFRYVVPQMIEDAQGADDV